jgi:3-hydroxyisobutyrate dehydrogenase-like beta-hydroxyacid dehydrogenase
MAQLGFLGLGIMGYPMARHLLEAGHEVALWTHSSAKARELAAKGNGTACATPKEVAQRSDFICYCVGDNAMARAITIGKDGLIEGLRPNSVTADCSTISPTESIEIGAMFTAKGAHFLDAPITGSKAGAEGGTLTFMVGGDQGAFERSQPYFEAMGKRMFYCGAAGQGLQAKLALNLVSANLLQTFSEALVLAVKNGIKPELMLEIFDNTAGKSALMSAKAPSILKRDFSTKFSVKWMHKDVGLALESAKALDLPLPLTAITEQMLRATIAKGYGEDDFCSVIRIMEDLAGVEVKN